MKVVNNGRTYIILSFCIALFKRLNIYVFYSIKSSVLRRQVIGDVNGLGEGYVQSVFHLQLCDDVFNIFVREFQAEFEENTSQSKDGDCRFAAEISRDTASARSMLSRNNIEGAPDAVAGSSAPSKFSLLLVSFNLISNIALLNTLPGSANSKAGSSYSLTNIPRGSGRDKRMLSSDVGARYSPHLGWSRLHSP